MSEAVAQLKERVITAETERDYYRSLVDSFFTGEAPEGGNFNHLLMAQWGRKRLAERKKQVAALLAVPSAT
jgi:hypothetical protein